MKHLAHWLLVPALLMAAAPARARTAATVAPTVKDEAHFFSEGAIKQADRKVLQIHRDFHKDLLIETLPQVPADLEDQYKKEGKEKFFNTWAINRARLADVDGIYVLICKSPGHIEAEVGNKTRLKAFTLDNRKKLLEIMLGHFREKRYDAALTEGVDYVYEAMHENLGPPRREEPAPSGADGGGSSWPPWLGWVCIGLVGFVVLWLIIGVVRAVSGLGRRPAYGGPGPGGYGGGGYAPGGYGGGGYAPGYGGGGGFWSSLLGGMFGATAGNWIYDSFFHRGASMGGGTGGWSAPSQPQGGGMQTGPDQPDTDYSGAGGDFSDTGGAEGGGGDFGGGDAGGGGDFGGNEAGGGGDFGGGGGDFGGGGGDSGAGGDF
jgi:uncharacterized protein